MVLSTRQMSVSCAEVEFILSPPKARSPCLQHACKVRDTHVRCRASIRRLRPLAASHVRRWHRARTLEARLSKSRLALNLHLPAAQTVPATHVGGAPPCAARTCLLRSLRRRSARSSYCTLFNNRCVPLRLSKHAPATCVGGTVLCVSATESAADPPQRGARRFVTEALKGGWWGVCVCVWWWWWWWGGGGGGMLMGINLRLLLNFAVNVSFIFAKLSY